MTIQDWGAIGELVGGAAVLVTLVYLALQVRQTQQFMRAQAYQDRSTALVDVHTRMAESEALSGLSLKVRGLGLDFDSITDQLTPLERERYWNLLFAHQHRLNNLVHQHEQGMLSDEYREGGLKPAIRLFAPLWKAFDVPIQGEAMNRTVEEVLASTTG